MVVHEADRPRVGHIDVEQPLGLARACGTSQTGAMDLRQELSPSLRRRFQTGRPSLDFTHTGGDGEFAKWELLHQPADVARFLAVIIGTEPPRVRERDMPAVSTLRNSLTTIARTMVVGRPLLSESVAVVNAAASKPPLVPQLAAEGAGVLVRGSATQALSTLARDAIDLFASPLAARIRVCEADDCGLLFVDASRPGRRRWCSMQWCGDRMKKRSAGRPVHKGATT